MDQQIRIHSMEEELRWNGVRSASTPVPSRAQVVARHGGQSSDVHVAEEKRLRFAALESVMDSMDTMMQSVLQRAQSVHSRLEHLQQEFLATHPRVQSPPEYYMERAAVDNTRSAASVKAAPFWDTVADAASVRAGMDGMHAEADDDTSDIMSVGSIDSSLSLVSSASEPPEAMGTVPTVTRSMLLTPPPVGPSRTARRVTWQQPLESPGLGGGSARPTAAPLSLLDIVSREISDTAHHMGELPATTAAPSNRGHQFPPQFSRRTMLAAACRTAVDPNTVTSRVTAVLVMMVLLALTLSFAFNGRNR
jgi:predicted nuclease with RNAse H fold